MVSDLLAIDQDLFSLASDRDHTVVASQASVLATSASTDNLTKWSMKMVFMVEIHSQAGRLLGKAVIQAGSYDSALSIAEDRLIGAYDGQEIIRIQPVDTRAQVLMLRSYD